MMVLTSKVMITMMMMKMMMMMKTLASEKVSNLVYFLIFSSLFIAHASPNHFPFSLFDPNRPSSYSTKEPGSSVIFIQIHTRGSIE